MASRNRVSCVVCKVKEKEIKFVSGRRCEHAVHSRCLNFWRSLTCYDCRRGVARGVYPEDRAANKCGICLQLGTRIKPVLQMDCLHQVHMDCLNDHRAQLCPGCNDFVNEKEEVLKKPSPIALRWTARKHNNPSSDEDEVEDEENDDDEEVEGEANMSRIKRKSAIGHQEERPSKSARHVKKDAEKEAKTGEMQQHQASTSFQPQPTATETIVMPEEPKSAPMAAATQTNEDHRYKRIKQKIQDLLEGCRRGASNPELEDFEKSLNPWNETMELFFDKLLEIDLPDDVNRGLQATFESIMNDELESAYKVLSSMTNIPSKVAEFIPTLKKIVMYCANCN
ncbi:hypothetical protein AVEN_42550-1 [Araneus ventricosus]|uniref:RING-type domain-containing protein n=1 Tax=Araneus ventricosus TaxID=182803 RepID=A0A4Y2T5H7_ARAVE|nr:hypothetical protein AVEN_42550-1 [Araneus ventricosus]